MRRLIMVIILMAGKMNFIKKVVLNQQWWVLYVYSWNSTYCTLSASSTGPWAGHAGADSTHLQRGMKCHQETETLFETHSLEYYHFSHWLDHLNKQSASEKNFLYLHCCLDLPSEDDTGRNFQKSDFPNSPKASVCPSCSCCSECVCFENISGTHAFLCNKTFWQLRMPNKGFGLEFIWKVGN